MSALTEARKARTTAATLLLSATALVERAERLLASELDDCSLTALHVRVRYDAVQEATRLWAHEAVSTAELHRAEEAVARVLQMKRDLSGL